MGLTLLFLFIILPLTAILLVGWAVTQHKAFKWAVLALWLTIFSLGATFAVVAALKTPRNLAKSDYYGWYVIDREYFPGRQADWQYNSLRFRITPSDSIYFYLADKERIVKVFRGRISTNEVYVSQRLTLHMAQPTYHVVADNPTTYRSTWNFHLVFHSAKFNDVYFKKGEWRPLPE